MIAEIANTLARIAPTGGSRPEEPAVCVIEAGTGTGKTIAYAVTAIVMAQALGKRLVVATATVALQEQFVNKDLPDIARHSGLQFGYALAKGRRRYVCLSKLDRLLAQSQGQSDLLPLYPDEVEPLQAADAEPTYIAMLDALGRGEWDGDRDNWSEALPESLWYGVTTDHSQCSGRRCPNISQCSFFRARDELGHADVIVANHDLVLADLALGGGAILPEPEHCIYIFDEGHHLPDKALSHFATFCRLHTSIVWLQESAQSVTAALPLLSGLHAMRDVQHLPARMEEAVDALKVVEQVVETLFDNVEVGPRNELRLRFEHGHVPQELQTVANVLAGQFRTLSQSLSRIETVLAEALEDEYTEVPAAEVEIWHLNIGAMLSRSEATLALWEAYSVSTVSTEEQPPMARWISLLDGAAGGDFELRCSPILAADLLAEYLWPRAAGIVITSATIMALGSFERFILHSGVSRQARFKVVASPFDYSRAIFQVPTMDCDPGDAERHTNALIKQLPDVLDEKEASLVLFSSRRQMLDVYAGIDAGWRARILMQGDASKQEILRQHRERIDAAKGSIIFGLASFAEGVDLPGQYCRHVVIAKIPFAVPDSPIEAALAEWIESRGGNAFMEISVPDAALKLVQASGRLLRTEQDSGRVTLMDRRILSRRYGRAILDSLPPFRRQLQ